MIEYRQMDTNTLFEGELTMKLKGRVLALTMALMLIITSMSGFALAESVSISVNATANADGTTNVSASFSGFPANAGNATTVRWKARRAIPLGTHQNLNVASGRNGLSFRPQRQYASCTSGSYTITAYLDGELNAAPLPSTVKGAPAGDSGEPKERRESSESFFAKASREMTNESEGGQAPSDAENGVTLMSTEPQKRTVLVQPGRLRSTDQYANVHRRPELADRCATITGPAGDGGRYQYEH